MKSPERGLSLACPTPIDCLTEGWVFGLSTPSCAAYTWGGTMGESSRW
jgi:hypothetical protein